MMFEKINEILQNYKQLILVQGIEEQLRWKELENNIEIPVQYQLEFIKYQTTYFQEKDEAFYELSLIIYSGVHDIGLWPICIKKNCEGWQIGSLGGEIIKPLFNEKMIPNVKTRRKYFRILLKFLYNLSQEINIKSLHFSESISNSVDLWHRMLMEEGAEIESVTHELYYNLMLPVHEADKKMHKKVRQDINKGYKYYRYEVICSESKNIDDMIELFRKYHIEISGRETRSKKTWEKQAEGIRKNKDFAVYLYDLETGELHGASLFTVTNHFCYYSVAAYNRDRFDRPIGHMVQDIAINYLRQMGVKWYVIGDRYYAADHVDSKMLSISKYKEAFATDIFPKMHLKISIEDFEPI